MRRRVTHDQDYIAELADSIERERARDPDVILPWSWWCAQAQLYGVTPNNIYSRATARGLYIPPALRGGEKGEAAPKRPRRAAAALEGAGPPPPGPEAPPSTATARILTERLHAMADVAGALADLEARAAAVERSREKEDLRRRETLRALDRLSRVLTEAVATVGALERLFQDDGS